MNETSLEEYRRVVEAQASDLLRVVQTVASGDLSVEVPIPSEDEGVQVLTELAAGVDRMVDELRSTMADQERARAEVERGRLQLAATLKELLAVQRRYLEERWDRHTAASPDRRGYFRYGEEQGPTADAWLPAMTAAVLGDGTVTENGPGETLAFPIRLHGEMVGVVGLSRDEVKPWSEEEITAAKTIMDELAEALDKQRLLDESQRRAWQLETSNEVGHTISSTLDLEKLLRQIVDTIKARFNYYYVAIMLVEGDEIVFQDGTTVGDSDTRLERRGRAMDLDAPAGLVVEAVRTRQPVLVNNVHDDPRYFPVPEMPNTRSELDVPIVVAGRVIGVLDVQSNLSFAFTEDDVALLQALANQAGVAIENARLFQEAQNYAEEQTILRRISQAVGESLDMQDLMDTALDVVLTAIGFEAGLVSLSREGSKDLYLAAQRGLPEPLARKLQLDGLKGTLCEHVFQTGETVAIADVREGAPVDVTGVIRAGLLAYAGAPLMHRDRQLGTFCFFDPGVKTLDERDLLMLEAIGRQIGVGVANARLYQETEAALAEVEAVHQSYLRRGWQQHLRQREMLGRSGFIYESSGSEPKSEMIAAPDLWRPEMKQALAEGGPAIVRGSEPEQERAGVAVPIKLRGQTLGIVGIETEAGDRMWTEDEIALLAAVSEQLGQALESARLFADTERSAERERLIGDITAKIRASTNVQDILETTAAELGRALGTSRALVRLAPPRPGADSLRRAGSEDGEPWVGRQPEEEEPDQGKHNV